MLAPHYAGAKTKDTIHEVEIRRYRYFLPSSMENIAYNGGGVYRIRKSPLYVLKLICFVVSQFGSTLWYVLTKQIDILNPHWIIPQGFVAVIVKFITRKKVVLTVHGGDVFNITSKPMTALKRFILKHADEVCPNSEATMQGCKTIFNRSYTIIPMGIDMKKFEVKVPSGALQKKYDLHGFTILFVGRLTEVKGVKYLLEAAKKMVEQKMDFKVLIVGDGPLKHDFSDYINRHGLKNHVTLTGWVDSSQLNEYYSVADVFVGPSISEPQGLVFVEALAAGTPVVASKVGGIVDIVSHGETGYLVQPRSSDALVDRLRYLMEHPDILKVFSAHARVSVRRRFSWHATTERYTALFEKLTS